MTTKGYYAVMLKWIALSITIFIATIKKYLLINTKDEYLPLFLTFLHFSAI